MRAKACRASAERPAQRIEVSMKIKPLIAARAKAKQKAAIKDRDEKGRSKATDPLCQKSDKGFDTKKEAAALAGVSHDTGWHFYVEV